MTRTLITLGLSSLLLLSLPANAEATAAAKASAQPAAVQETPDSLIQMVAQQLITRIKADREALQADAGKLYAMVNEIVLPHFDFELMGRLVLGNAWKDATPEQQQKFLESFKTLLVKTYSNALLQYSDEQLEFSPAKEGSKPDRASVTSIIRSAGSSDVEMDYKMRQLDGKWLVYDVVVDNISLVTNYRGTYASEIQRGGLDSLIAKLHEQAS